MSAGTPQSTLHERIATRRARIGIIGVGYVGLPLAVVFAEAGFRVTGFDLSADRAATINNGISYIEDIPSSTLANLVNKGLIDATTDMSRLTDMDAISVCVPTPLSKTRDPDMSAVLQAASDIANNLRPGQLIVLESTTYPGTTREIFLPRIQERGFQIGHDVFLTFSPERVDPGRTDWTTQNTPKIMGGITPACLDIGRALYESAIKRVVPVSSPEAAEMAKLLENTFRAVNIGLVNEVQLMCDRLGLNAWEVIEAAATKPFGFMKFTPGPGLGGHCIPIDPLYLSWKLKTLDYTARFIELASEVNTSMPRYWVQKVADALNDQSKAIRGSTVLVLGVAYKKDVSDVRESPALDIIHLLREKGAHVTFHDPHVASIRIDGERLYGATDLTDALHTSDCVIIATDHSSYDWAHVKTHAPLVIDTRNALKA
ncbi:MAG: nucleotide sugar dehydrogenase [Roseiflexaceae bacterium]